MKLTTPQIVHEVFIYRFLRKTNRSEIWKSVLQETPLLAAPFSMLGDQKFFGQGLSGQGEKPIPWRISRSWIHRGGGHWMDANIQRIFPRKQTAIELL